MEYSVFRVKTMEYSIFRVKIMEYSVFMEGRGLHPYIAHVSVSDIGILGQVWYLIVSIPDLFTLTYCMNQTKEINKSFVKSLKSYLKL